MDFLYVFSLMFLSIFGLTMLIKLLVWRVLSAGVRHDIYVRSGEDISGFVESARRCPRIGRIVIIAAGNEWDEEAERLARKYSGVVFRKDMEQ